MSRFANLVFALVTCFLVSRLALAGEASAIRTRAIVDFSDEKLELPARHGITFKGNDAPGAKPLSIAVTKKASAERSKAVRALRIELGSVSSCEYWFELDLEGVEWGDVCDGQMVLRLYAPGGVSTTLCLDVAGVAIRKSAQHRLSASMTMASRILRTAMARDGYADIPVPLRRFRERDADGQVVDKNQLTELSAVHRVAIEFKRHPHAKDDADATVALYSITLKSSADGNSILQELERRAFAYF